MIDYQQFYDTYGEQFANDSNFSFVCSEFESLFADGDFENGKQLFSLFRSSHRRIGRTRFFTTKKYLKLLYQWLHDCGYVTKEQVLFVDSITMSDVLGAEGFMSCYFKDLDDVLDYVGYVETAFGYGDDAFLFLKSAIILTWYGVSISKLPSIKKSDIVLENPGVVTSDSFLGMEREHVLVLKRFSALEMYRGLPSYRSYTYRQSDYLFRTKNSESVTCFSIENQVRIFNKIAFELQGVKITLKAIQVNGVFFRYYDSELKQIPQKAESYWEKAPYQKWKEIFYPEEVV